MLFRSETQKGKEPSELDDEEKPPQALETPTLPPTAKLKEQRKEPKPLEAPSVPAVPPAPKRKRKGIRFKIGLPSSKPVQVGAVVPPKSSSYTPATAQQACSAWLSKAAVHCLVSSRSASPLFSPVLCCPHPYKPPNYLRRVVCPVSQHGVEAQRPLW